MSNSISASNSIGGYRYIDIGLYDLEKNLFVNFHGVEDAKDDEVIKVKKIDEYLLEDR
ncbi:hypothetical protein [uncultured Sphaerochaeta sp.]|uniref:hypothetical protein n=1 Tax=uncultured Sphaerochaeta sp. TaxID=886478 RepID=UPI002A0A2508|nr:hypothetical protein [uncultured Sphaerochaeta sp.]